MKTKNVIIGYMELIYAGEVIVVQAMTSEGDYAKAEIVERWRKRYGNKLLKCDIKTHLYKKLHVSIKLEDKKLPELKD